jgi:hypothetical protein
VIYSLDPPDERPGWWDEVDLKDLIDPGEKIRRFEDSVTAQLERYRATKGSGAGQIAAC